ncbi:tRNA (adenosine(37)-N6)-threonylcarbamoyltransferase complex dimerization subunit type 1 TsaB [Falsihalocynthiibacter sp. SS001]|uniref:tRNA (adenosine(37)-N6)-threonylcarbamoyltransferase complex dimerization subunit type 1 TsaB n=1 Tax=Falsihalocynthiibacter sp. SS001 TaxID=3349698 RepID=UPI0036D3E30B
MPPNAPLVLGFDTSAAHCAAALLSGDLVLAQQYAPMQKGQAENLVPILESTLAQAGHNWSDLDAIGVGTGPGNFTGIRISVACARGMALALGIPAVGVTALEAQAFGVTRPVYSLIPARRNMYYIQKVGDHGAPVEQLSLEDAQARVAGAKSVGPVGQSDFPEAQTPIAEAIARIASERFASQDPTQRPAPFYMRAADAAPAKDAPPTILDAAP